MESYLKGLNVLSLFDGMSGGRISLERAGVEVKNYYSSEIDKSAIFIANKNYPRDEKNRLGSVIDLTDELLLSLDIDVLIGGSPCQGFSMSGKRLGASTSCGIDITTLEQYLELKEEGFEFEGQSYLFWEYVRVMKIIEPKYFFLENVRMESKWKDLFNKTMGTTSVMINSNVVSGQNRVRFYWTNIPYYGILKDKEIHLSEVLDPIQEVIDPAITGQEKVNVTEQIEEVQESECVIHSLRCKTGWQRQKVGIKKSPTLLTGGFLMGRDKFLNVKVMTAADYERLQTVPEGYTEGVSEIKRKHMLGNGWTIDVIVYFFKGLNNKPLNEWGF